MGRLTSKLVGVIGTITNTKRPLPGHQTKSRSRKCHRRAPARASPRTISPIPEERNARLVRPRPRRGLSPPQYSAPSLAAGAAGDEGAADKPSRRARPLSRSMAIASRGRWTAMGQSPPVRAACMARTRCAFVACSIASILQAASACPTRNPPSRGLGGLGGLGRRRPSVRGRVSRACGAPMIWQLERLALGQRERLRPAGLRRGAAPEGTHVEGRPAQLRRPAKGCP